MSCDASFYTYEAYGLTIRSDIALPDYFSVSEPAIRHDIDIKKVERPLFPNAPRGYWYIKEKETEIELFFEGVGNFSVMDGKRIAYTPLPGTETLALYLSGLVMGTLLHQRGYLVMHASAVVTSSGNVFAFCGESCSGKSSTAGLLCQQGYGFMADDVIAVPCHTSAIRIDQGRKHLRINPDMLKFFNNFNGLQYSNFERKYLIDFSGQRALSGVLRAIFVFNDATSRKNDNNLELLNKANSVFELTKNSMPVRLLQRTCDHSQLEKCSWLARRIPIYRFYSSCGKAGNHSTHIDVIAEKIAQLDFKNTY